MDKVDLVFAFSIIIPAIIGLVRYTKINKAYYPFIYCIWIGLINEIVSYCLIERGYYNTVNSNIFMLLESLLLLWQFKNWGLFQKKKLLLQVILMLIVIAWVLENFIFFKITRYNSYFLITYSFLISFMSISIINRLIVTERKRLVKNPTFILCVAFVMYYTYSVFSEAFWIYGVDENPDLAVKVHSITVLTNFIAILLYTVAILWMPSKQKFTLPSS